MPTERQRKAVNEMVVNGGLAQPAMRKAGYSENTVHTPQKLTESKGFEELCKECGLTKELILNSLTEDIKKKPQNRKPELELGAKIRGMLTERSEINAHHTYAFGEYKDNLHTTPLEQSTSRGEGEMEGAGSSQESGENNSLPESSD